MISLRHYLIATSHMTAGCRRNLNNEEVDTLTFHESGMPIDFLWVIPLDFKIKVVVAMNLSICKEYTDAGEMNSKRKKRRHHSVNRKVSNRLSRWSQFY